MVPCKEIKDINRKPRQDVTRYQGLHRERERKERQLEVQVPGNKKIIIIIKKKKTMERSKPSLMQLNTGSLGPAF